MYKNGINIEKEDFFKMWFKSEDCKITQPVYEILKKLKNEKYKIVLATNQFKERAEYMKENFSELMLIFNRTYFSCDLGVLKTEKEFFEKILSDYEVKPEKTLHPV